MPRKTLPTGHRLLLCAALAAALPTARAGAQALGPQLQDATISGQGGTLVIKRLPVRTQSGTVYRDITIELKVDARGGLVARGAAPALPAGAAAPQAAAAAAAVPGAPDIAVATVHEAPTPPEKAAVFIPGLYQDAEGNLLNLTNTGRAITPTGVWVHEEDFPTYRFAAIGGGAISAAHWYAGPLRTNPAHRLIQIAGVSDDSYSYGTIDGAGGGDFDSGMLIGARQTGATLTIVSFHKRGCCTYSNTPTGALQFTLVHRR